MLQLIVLRVVHVLNVQCVAHVQRNRGIVDWTEVCTEVCVLHVQRRPRVALMRRREPCWMSG